MTESSPYKTALIIGAGPAGLTSAYQLIKETDILPVIIEESSDIGGLSKTVEYKGNRIDIGGHRFFSKNKQVNEIWTKLMPHRKKIDSTSEELNELNKNTMDFENNDKIMLLRKRVSRIFYLRKFFDYPLSPKISVFVNLGLKNTLYSMVGIFSSLLKKRKENSLEDFYVNRFGKGLYEIFFKDYTEKVWGVKPSEISPDWGIQRIKGLSLSKVIKEAFAKLINRKNSSNETSLIEEFLYPKKGPGQLWEIMADEIKAAGGQILLNHKVIAVKSNDNKITEISTQTNDNKVVNFKSEIFFSSMPIKDFVSSMQTDVPAEVKNSANNLLYRDFITVGLLLKQLKIKNGTNPDKLIDDCWIYIQEKDVKITRLQIYNNWSPYLPADNKNTVWVGLEYCCNEGDDLWNMPPDEFIEFAISELSKINMIDKKDIIDSTHIKVKKAYPCYFGAYNKLNLVVKYLNQYENLYCIGRNGQHRYNNMDHSMLTSIIAVDLLKNNIKDKSQIWEVNAEKEFLEIHTEK